MVRRYSSGYMPVGMAFGVLATTLGFSVFQAVTCSATAFAGAGQFITLSLMRAGEAAIAVVAATTVVNLRHVLFAATISPYLRGMPARKQAFLAFTLTDETFALNISDLRQGLATGASMAGVGAIAWTGWVLGTLTRLGSRWLDRRPDRLGSRLRDAGDVHRSLHRTRREQAAGRCRRGRRSDHARTSRCSATWELDIPRVWHIMIAAIVAATAGAVVFDE